MHESNKLHWIVGKQRPVLSYWPAGDAFQHHFLAGGYHFGNDLVQKPVEWAPMKRIKKLWSFAWNSGLQNFSRCNWKMQKFSITASKHAKTTWQASLQQGNSLANRIPNKATTPLLPMQAACLKCYVMVWSVLVLIWSHLFTKWA